MPIGENELDEIRIKGSKIIAELEKGMFYSKDELAQRIFGHRLDQEAFLKHLPKKASDKETADYTTIMLALTQSAKDAAYLEAFLLVHLTNGDLVEGVKDGVPYYGKIK